MIINGAEEELLKRWINNLRTGIVLIMLLTLICIFSISLVIVNPVVIILSIAPPFISMIWMYVLMYGVQTYREMKYVHENNRLKVIKDSADLENPLVTNEAL